MKRSYNVQITIEPTAHCPYIAKSKLCDLKLTPTFSLFRKFLAGRLISIIPIRIYTLLGVSLAQVFLKLKEVY